MNKAVFLDRDGTINKDFGYVFEKERLEFIPGVLDALKKIQQHGFKLIIITNQSGIGRGYFTMQQYREFENYMIGQISDYGVRVDAVYFCPHTPKEHCSCRKPQIKMFELAAQDFDIEWKYSFAVGDNERDLAVCDVKNIQGILYGSTGKIGHHKIGFENWTEIAEYICQVHTKGVLSHE